MFLPSKLPRSVTSKTWAKISASPPSVSRSSAGVQTKNAPSSLCPPPGGSESVTRYKALRIDFARPGDERRPNEREIRLLEPPYEWVYF